MTLIPGKDAVEALDDPAAMQALYEGISLALRLEPVPEDDPEESPRRSYRSSPQPPLTRYHAFSSGYTHGAKGRRREEK